MQIKINKRSAYAPIRYEATRPFAVRIGRAFVAEQKRGEAARTAFVRGPLLPLLRNAATKIGREQGPGPIQSEIVNVQIFGMYLDAGKVIFDLSKDLTQTLLMTDAEDIPCGELTFPADSFYLHFGSESGLSDEGLSIEGAFVTKWSHRMTVDLVTEGFGKAHFLSLPSGESCIGAPIGLDSPSKTVAQALSESVANLMEVNAKTLEQMAEVERQLERKYGQVVKIPSVHQRLTEKEPLIRRALSLIVNAMFYLAAEPEDIEDDWGRDTPTEFVNALNSATAAATVKTIQNTLLKAGYSKVRFVGKKFSDSVAARQIRDATLGGRVLSAHFRRGHFRRQPFGPERTLRKTIFIAPVVVNAESGGEPKGRIYVVSAPNNS